MYNLSFMLLLVILACWLCRRFAAAIGQPEFIGDILTGVVIGPYFLGGYLPVMLPVVDVVGFIELLRGLSDVALVWILIEVVWCATDFPSGSLKQKPVMIIAFFSISIPFMVGAVLGYYSKNDLAFGQSAIGYMLFCGVAFSVTALPVLGVMIERLQFIDRSIGGAALAAALYTDAFAWVSLALVVGGWGGSGESDSSMLLRLCGLISLFVVAVLIRRMVTIFEVKAIVGRPTMMLVLFLFVMLCASLTHGLGFHGSIGAIVAVFALADIRGLRTAWEQWEGNLRVVMVPMFFIGTGTMLTFSGFNDSGLWIWVVVFVAAGVASKVISSLIAGLLLGMPQRDSLELGFLMATKGTAELVVLSVGHNASLLSDDSYMALLLLSVVSTLLTTPSIILLNKFRGGFLKSIE